MSPVSGSFMKMRARVMRNTSVDDTWNMPGKPGWTVHLDAQPCYLWVDAKRYVDGSGRLAAIENVRGIFPAGLDLLSGDMVTDVSNLAGDVVLGGDFKVEVVSQRTSRTAVDHLDVLLLRAK